MSDEEMRRPGSDSESMLYIPMYINTDLTLSPKAKVGDIKTHMCSKNVVCQRRKYREDGSIVRYTIYQKICLEIPLELSVSADEECM